MSRRSEPAAPVGVLVAGHGQAASGLLSAARLIAGDTPGSAAADLGETDSPEDFGTRLTRAATTVDGGAGVLVLADLPGATPFTTAVRMSREHPATAVVAGVNLPMLLEVLLQREGTTLEQLADLAESAGRQGVTRWRTP